MIFKHGFVHCDPHAANVMVRPLPSRKWNILGGKFVLTLNFLFHFVFFNPKFSRLRYATRNVKITKSSISDS